MLKRIFIIFTILLFTVSNSVLASEPTILDKVNSPADVKKLSIKQMNTLAQDIRQGILHRVNLTGRDVAMFDWPLSKKNILWQ